MRTLRFLEKFFIVLTVIGILLKLTGAGGGGIFIVTGSFFLSIIYFFGTYFLLQEPATKKGILWLSVFTGITFSICVVGILFKLQFWPGAEINLLTGMVLCALTVIVAIFLRNRKEADEGMHNYFRVLIKRALLAISFAALFFAVPQRTIINIEYRKDPEYARLLNEFLADPDNKTKWESLARYEMKSGIKDQPMPAQDSLMMKNK